MSDKVFADADSDFESSDFVIIGIPLDETGSHRSGTGEAPEFIRKESYNFETYIYDLEVDLADLKIHDAGDIPLEGLPDFFSNLGDRFPVIIGGEHSISPYIVKELKPDSILVLDAHLDYRDEYEGNKNSHACATRRMAEVIGIENVVAVGIRSMCKEEMLDAKNHGLKYITVEEMAETTQEKLFEKLGNLLSGKIYISLDMDVIDPAFAPGVGTPEPIGITPCYVRKIIRHFSDRLVGLDIVEVCPPFDNGNTAGLAAKLIRDVIASVHLRK